MDAYTQTQRNAGLVMLHRGQLRLERYGLGFDAQGRWTSFSVAKSLTATLVGILLSRAVKKPLATTRPKKYGCPLAWSSRSLGY